jgi:hypothetical protein
VPGRPWSGVASDVSEFLRAAASPGAVLYGLFFGAVLWILDRRLRRDVGVVPKLKGYVYGIGVSLVIGLFAPLAVVGGIMGAKQAANVLVVSIVGGAYSAWSWRSLMRRTKAPHEVV